MLSDIHSYGFLYLFASGTTATSGPPGMNSQSRTKLDNFRSTVFLVEPNYGIAVPNGHVPIGNCIIEMVVTGP